MYLLCLAYPRSTSAAYDPIWHDHIRSCSVTVIPAFQVPVNCLSTVLSQRYQSYSLLVVTMAKNEQISDLFAWTTLTAGPHVVPQTKEQAIHLSHSPVIHWAVTQHVTVLSVVAMLNGRDPQSTNKVPRECKDIGLDTRRRSYINIDHGSSKRETRGTSATPTIGRCEDRQHEKYRGST